MEESGSVQNNDRSGRHKKTDPDQQHCRTRYSTSSSEEEEEEEKEHSFKALSLPLKLINRQLRTITIPFSPCHLWDLSHCRPAVAAAAAAGDGGTSVAVAADDGQQQQGCQQ
jgi:hypothetical protein